MFKAFELLVKPLLTPCFRLIDCKNEAVIIFAERLGGSIANFNKKNADKIWLNYKLLEAELERINFEKHVKEEIFCRELNFLDHIYLKNILEDSDSEDDE